LDVRKASRMLSSLWPDGGKTLLAEGSLSKSWPVVLAKVPPALIKELPQEEPALALLIRLRDHWSKTKNLRAAIATTKALLRLHIEKKGHDAPDTLVELGTMGVLAQKVGKRKEAEKMLVESWSKLRSVAGGRDLRLANAASNLGVFYTAGGDLEKAEPLFLHSYRIRKVVAPETVGTVAAQLAEVRLRLKKVDEALPLLREAWLSYLDNLGPDHPLTAARAQTLANVLNKLKLYREAAPVLREVLRIARIDGDREKVANAGFDLGVALRHAFKKEEGLRLIEEALRYTRESGNMITPHPALPSRATMFANILVEKGRYDQAEGLMNEALEAEKVLFGEHSVEVAGRYAALGFFAHQRGRNEHALGWLDVATALLRSTVGDEDPKTLRVAELQVKLMVRQAKYAREKRDRLLAKELITRAKRLAVPVLGANHELCAEIEKLERG
jgi:tetratricopeptide (TPR) repeat protein